MTTDPFTEAANAAAREYAQTPRMNVGTVRDRIGEAHADGWEAARTHLAVQEPTDAEIEAAAEAICSGEGGCDPCFNWDDSVDGGCTYCTRHARAALSAARTDRRDEEHR